VFDSDKSRTTNSQASIASSAKKKFDGESKAQQAAHRAIARRYAWDERRQSDERRRYPFFAVKRLRELENLFARRYGATLPDDDAGRDDLYIAASHIFQMGSPDVHIPAWARLWAPWLGEEECAALIAEVARKREHWKAAKLGQVTRLTDVERTEEDITTFWPFDVPRTEVKKRRKRKYAAYQQAQRADAGAKPHALSAAQTKPWKDCSRATHYRRQKAARVAKSETSETNSSAADTYYVVTTKQSHRAQAEPVPDTLRCHPTGGVDGQRAGVFSRAVPALSITMASS